jgi:dihydrodipicolinate synthase/N-acetylneuraminate lyase
MNQSEITPEMLAGSVISVPPLARNADFSLNRAENEKLIRHLEGGGVSTLLYGGNAILYHVALSEYAELLQMMTDLAGENTLMIPSVGPAYGTMMDQAKILREFNFPTAMILPTRDVVTSSGVASGVASAVRNFVEATSKRAVLYIKNDGFIEVGAVKKLVDDGLLSWIKYAVVREDTSHDPYLRELGDAVGTERIVSGIGEQPAIVHLRDFGLKCFTSGCVCVAPGKSMEMLQAIKAGDFETAEQIQATFKPLEDLRNSINPIRVLHTAVALSGIANTGPIIPLMSELNDSDRPAIQAAAATLLEVEQARTVSA